MNGKCSTKYSTSFWVLLPSKTALKDTRNFTIVIIGPLTMEVVRNGSDEQASSFSIYLNVTFNSATCEWELGTGISMFGVWLHYVIAVDASKKSIKFYQNREVGIANLKRCTSRGTSENKVIFGGGMPMLCYDEFSLWAGNMDQNQVEKLYNAIAFSGKKNLLTINRKFCLWPADVKFITQIVMISKALCIPAAAETPKSEIKNSLIL